MADPSFDWAYGKIEASIKAMGDRGKQVLAKKED